MRESSVPGAKVRSYKKILPLCISVFLCIISILGLFQMLLSIQGNSSSSAIVDFNIVDSFSTQISNQIGRAMEGAPEIRPVYQLSDQQLIAPRPNPSAFGEADTPSELQAILNQAKEQLSLQASLFTAETPIKNGSTIHYYLDESIFVVTWKQVLQDCTYTFSEIKIMHPSQIRRFFSEGQFGSGVLRTTTEMAQTVNAVVASSGDYYGYRTIGIVVNNHQVYRHMGHLLDTCFVDENGDLLFAYAGQITDLQAAQQFIDKRNVRFSLSFGPVLLLNGEYCVPETYNSGEVNTEYARSAICQLDSLHYLLVTANMEPPNYNVPTVGQFARNLQQLGIPKAYALDGGQTAAIAMNGKLMNTVSYGSQREISDIVYFATAVPES